MPFEIYHSPASTASIVNIPALGMGLMVRMPQEKTDGSIIVFESVNLPGFGPPLHRHTQTEIFRVLEGEYLYEVDGRRFLAVEGDLVTVPGGVAHTFTNTSEHSARQLVMMLPAMDAVTFFKGLGEVMADYGKDREALAAYGSPWGMEFLGPPISVEE